MKRDDGRVVNGWHVYSVPRLLGWGWQAHSATAGRKPRVCLRVFATERGAMQSAVRWARKEGT